MPLLFSHCLPVSSHSYPYPFLNTTQIMHYLMPSCLLFSHCLPVSSHSYPYPFQYNSDYPLSHASALFSLIACIFSFLPLSLPIQLRLSIISCLCSSLTACLYLLILTLIPSNTNKIIHYLMPLLFSHCLPVSSHSYPYPFQYNSDHPLSHASALLSLLACIFSFLSLSIIFQYNSDHPLSHASALLSLLACIFSFLSMPYPCPFLYPFQQPDYPLSHASALLSLLASIFSYLPLSLPIQLRSSIISCLCSSLTACLYLLILTLIPSNTTQIIHYLMPLLIFSLIHCLPVSSHSYPYPFQYNSDYPLSHASALLSLLTCIFSFLPLSLPIQLRLSIISCLCSSLTACLYLLILTLIPPNTIQIIHYLMPLLFSHCLPVSSHSYPYPFQYN
ncbi:unnamed protein product [Acanthosepion pharaonis]|uniref:Uncharacterized protein n=1 Tax=Acanthosepion pharaonis TaxID=158019 RepID=A0A812DQY5_ACAPH|nr:unnamed protein product [Sepia pharaonis]